MNERFKKKLANWTSLVVAISGAILAVSDTIKSMDLIPGHLSNSWGLVLAISLIINRIGSILTHPAHTESDDKRATQAAIEKVHQSQPK